MEQFYILTNRFDINILFSVIHMSYPSVILLFTYIFSQCINILIKYMKKGPPLRPQPHLSNETKTSERIKYVFESRRIEASDSILEIISVNTPVMNYRRMSVRLKGAAANSTSQRLLKIPGKSYGCFRGWNCL